MTRDVLAAAVAGTAAGTVAAVTAGLATVIVDAGVADRPVPGARDARPREPRGDLVAADALSAADVDRLLEAGRELGRRAAATGRLVALGEVGIGNTTVAAALTAVLLDLEASAVVGLGAGADTAMLDRKRAVVTAALARAGCEHGPRLAEPLTALRAVGGPELAVLAGVTLGAAGAGAAVVLDGLATSVAAVVAVRLEPAAAAALVGGHRSRETAHAAVLGALGLEPLLDLRIRAGEGVGACLAAGLLADAIAVRRHTARTARTARTAIDLGRRTGSR